MSGPPFFPRRCAMVTVNYSSMCECDIRCATGPDRPSKLPLEPVKDGFARATPHLLELRMSLNRGILRPDLAERGTFGG